MEQRPEHHEDVWRCNQQERDEGTVSQRSREGGEEVLETSRTSDAEVHQSEEVGLGIRKCHLHSLQLRHFTLLILIGFSGIERKTLDGNVSHLGRQGFPGLREVGQKQGDDNADANGDDTFDDVQPDYLVSLERLSPAQVHLPLPCAHSIVTVETSQDTGGD